MKGHVFPFLLRSAVLSILMLFCPLGAQAVLPFEVRSGDLKAYLEGVVVPPQAGPDQYRPPTVDELATWRSVVQSVLAERYIEAAELASQIDYQLIYFRDTSTTASQHIVLREVSADPGWHGVYAFRINPHRNLVIESPHPLFDGTRVQGIDLYVETESLAFMQAGIHRNNHPDTNAPCDGLQTNGDPYSRSDMAHNVDTFFQVVHEEIHLGFNDAVCLSVHGMSASSHDSDVIISNGSTQPRSFADSLSLQLAVRMNELLQGDSAGRYAVSHQEPAVSYPLAGRTNKQGRFSNGSPNPCTTNTPNSALPERFIHMEQSSTVRNLPRSNWTFVTQALNDVMPLWPAAAVDPAPAPELIAYWPFDGDTSETVTNTLDGAPLAGVSVAAGRPDRAEGALKFDGVGAHVVLPNFDYSGDHEEFTLTLWFQSSSTPEPFQYLVSQGPMGVSAPGGSDAVNLPHSMHFYLTGTGSFRARFTPGNGVHWLHNGSGGWLDGQWHHLAVTYSFDDGVVVYLDGEVEGASAAVGGSRFKPETQLFIGARSDLGAGRFFGSGSANDGRINDVRLFNRALSQSEIESQYVADQVANRAVWLFD